MSAEQQSGSVHSASASSDGTKTALPDYFDGGWCWMCHPSNNDGNAVPVKMETIDGVRYYKPLDPTDATEFEWDERDSEWEVIAGPFADIAASESAAIAPNKTDSESALRASHDRLKEALTEVIASDLEMTERGQVRLLEKCSAAISSIPKEIQS